MLAVEERLEAEAVAGREENPGLLVPDDEGELSPQLVQALGPGLLVQVQGDFRVGSSAETVPSGLEGAAHPSEVVEFAVRRNAQPSVLAGDGLGALRVVDRKTGVTEADPPRWRRPDALAVGPAVRQGGRGAGYCAVGDRTVPRPDRDDAAHLSERQPPAGAGASSTSCSVATPSRQVNRIRKRCSPRVRSRLSGVTRWTTAHASNVPAFGWDRA